MPSPARFYHPFVVSDVDHILKLHTIKPSTQAEQQDNLSRIAQIVKNKFGPQYSVIDVSPNQYSKPLELVRQELCIVDPAPEDRSTQKVKEQHPALYEPRQAALDEALKDSGYQVRPLCAYPSQLLDALLPPREVSGTGQPFVLHPPSPAHAELQALLELCSLHLPGFPKLHGFLNLWIRSHNLEELFPPTCIALMTVTYLQSRHRLPSPFEVQKFKAISLTNEVIDGWFDFWSGDNPMSFKAKEVIASIRAPNGTVPRDDANPPPKTVPTDKQPDPQDISTTPKNAPTPIDQPKFWRGAALIVQDPFLLTHNHAHQVGAKDLRQFITHCKTARTNLRNTGPIHSSIFGPPFIALPQASPSSVNIATSQLTASLKAMFKNSRPPKHVLRNRQDILDRISTAVRVMYGDAYVVQCFGSTRYGVDSPSSDLDMVIVDLNRFTGFAPEVSLNNLPAVYNMRSLGQVLLRAGFDRVLPIYSATVPIVKFHDPKTNIHIDINCNERLGVSNTQLLESYCRIYPDLPAFVFFTKKWAKSMALNDPSGSKGPATFSSYCLALMIVGYLQSRGVLPNLQKRAKETQGDQNTQGFWMRTAKGDRIWCDTRFDFDPPPQWKATPMALGDAVCGWFRYWGYEHLYTTSVLSIRDGGIIPRQHPFTGDQKPPSKNSDAKAKPSKERAFQDTPEGSSLPTAVMPQPPDIESEPPLTLEDQEIQPSNDEAMVQETLDGMEESSVAVPELGKVEEELDSEEELEAPAAGEEPSAWKLGRLVVADPFIAAKNASGACRPKVIERFQLECQRVTSYLESGASIESLFIPGSDWLFGGSAGRPLRDKRRTLDAKKPRTQPRSENKDRGKARSTETRSREASPSPPPDRFNTPKEAKDKRAQQKQKRANARKQPTTQPTQVKPRPPSPRSREASPPPPSDRFNTPREAKDKRAQQKQNRVNARKQPVVQPIQTKPRPLSPNKARNPSRERTSPGPTHPPNPSTNSSQLPKPDPAPVSPKSNVEKRGRIFTDALRKASVLPP